MGICLSCCRKAESSQNLITPDAETRRRQQLDAVEKRLQQQENRGIKDPDKVRRQQQRKEEMEKREEEAARLNQTPGLKWQVE